VPLSSAPVQLLNLSVGQLRALATQQRLEPPTAATKKDLILLLVEGLTPEALQAAADDYLYAGRTSAAWVRFAGGPVPLAAFKGAVMQICGADPFMDDLRPALSSTPQMLSARAWRDDKVVLTFAVRGNERLVFQDFQLREVSEDIPFQAVFRLNDAVLEIRSSHVYVQKLGPIVGALASEMGRLTSSLPIGESEFEVLRAQLGASLVDYTGLDAGPSPYGTRSVTKKLSCPDLAANTQFQTDYGSLDAVRGEITFMGVDGEETKALVALRTSSVYFRSAASEGTIDRVYQALLVAWP
jgi:hypothetical protein